MFDFLKLGRREMRLSTIVIGAVLTVCSSAVFAQQSANFDACLALSEQRGAGIESGHRNHTGFMRDCLAGRVPFTTGGPAVAPAPQAYAESYDKCAALSEQRGAGTTSGGRNHREFMTECMAGRIR
jgi:hypothetical protein